MGAGQHKTFPVFLRAPFGAKRHLLSFILKFIYPVAVSLVVMWVTRELPRLNDYRIVFRVCAGKFASYPSDCGKVDEPGNTSFV